MSNYPPKLAELVEDFAGITDRNERVEALIEIADRFDAVRVPYRDKSRPILRV